ncbi:MAG TPA: hypothetical protein VHG52_03485 [Thermomicrobiales bacterium]|nr:hypothetical protein [Thermomicrobiales bacterium]
MVFFAFMLVGLAIRANFIGGRSGLDFVVPKPTPEALTATVPRNSKRERTLRERDITSPIRKRYAVDRDLHGNIAKQELI